MEGVYFNLTSPEGDTLLLKREHFVFWEKCSDCLILYPRRFEIAEQIRELLYCLDAVFTTCPNNMDIKVYSSDDSWYRVLGVISFMKYNDEPITLVRIQ